MSNAETPAEPLPWFKYPLRADGDFIVDWYVAKRNPRGAAILTPTSRKFSSLQEATEAAQEIAPARYSVVRERGSVIKKYEAKGEPDRNLRNAAPDLLAALEAIVADVGHQGHDGYYDGVIHSQEVDQARAAIAKATGGAA